jgi:hypothetical protein
VQEEQFVQKRDQQSDHITGLGRDGPLRDRPDQRRIDQQTEQPGRRGGEEPFEGIGRGFNGEIGRCSDDLESPRCVRAIHTSQGKMLISP